jgi:membrane protease YdiL (CAAX protease family)
MGWLRPRALLALLGYAALYALALAHLAHVPGFERGDSLVTLLVFGIGFSAVAWLVSRGAKVPPVTVKHPGREGFAILAYLAGFAVVVLGWLLSAVREVAPREPMQSIVILAVKLVTMVVLPAWLFARLGVRPGPLLAPRRFGLVDWRVFGVMGLLLLGLQAVAGRGLQSIALLGMPAWKVALFLVPAWAWLTIETGLCEEFLFRVLLQTRLAVALGSETAGILAMSLLFGLAHAPGYVLRGAHAMEGMTTAPDAWTAAAYAIVVVSPLGLVFGVLWARTHNLALVALLHGLTDLLPNLASFIRTWTRH